jgi:hypothetical protein
MIYPLFGLTLCGKPVHICSANRIELLVDSL